MKKTLLILLVAFIPMITFAQDLSVDWSKNISYDRMTTGSLEEFAGSNKDYVYAVFSPTYKKLYKTQRYLIVFDKKTMKQLGKISIKSKEEYSNICVTNDVVYVMFVSDSKGKEILYAQSYTPTLNAISQKKKVYQINTSTLGSSKYVKSIKTLSNGVANNNLYIVSERPRVKGENVEIEYTVVNNTLNVVNSGQIELPVQSTKNSAYNLSSIRVGDDGSLITKNSVKADADTKKDSKIFSYSILSVINTEKNTINSIPIKSSGKHIDDFEYFTENNKLHVVGIYSESVGKRSERGNGVFSSTLNSETGELENTKFTEISAPKIRFSLLYLEKVKYDEAGNIMLYATEDENIIRTYTDSKGNTRTTYENRKGDILIVSLNNEGELNWKNVLERRISYPELYVRDIQVILNAENSYLTYADKYKKGRRNIFNKKSNKEMRDVLSYSKINASNGNMLLQTLKLNKDKTEKSKMYYVNAAKITELDNTLFLDGYQPKIKTGVKVATCVTAPLCGIGCLYFLIKANNGSALTGGGYLGSVKLK